MNFITINNQQSVPVSNIPEMKYDVFLELNTTLLHEHPERHCVLYFGYPERNKIRLICCIADDRDQNIMVSSSTVSTGGNLSSFSAKHICFEKFEREIHENFGISYSDHPWLKPVRYPENRAD
jgi:NADH:ubiquinone oxidoreductase subunit C